MIIRKIMLFGDIGVGKTSIANRLVFDRFSGEYKATIGVDVYRYEVAPPLEAGRFQFLVFDTDGNYGSSIFREVSVREAHAAMIVGDVSRRRTLDAMVQLADGFLDAFPGRYAAFILNKLDLVEPGTEPDIPERIARGELPIFNTSAKTGDHIRGAFHDAASTIVRRGL